MINLTKSQKKFLKNNLKKLSLTQLAEGMGLAEKDLSRYLKEHLPKERYEKIIAFSQKDQKVKTSVVQTGVKTFLAKNWYFLVILVVLVSAVYANSLKNEFLSDDIATIRDNPQIANLNPEGGLNFLLNLRPTLLALTYRLFGLNPIFFRLTNILCHLGSTLTLLVLMNFFFNPIMAFFIASVFAVHPLLIEGVTWISGGPYSISTFLILQAFFFYLKAREQNKKLFYIICLIFFYFALTQAIQAVIFPIIIFWYELFLGNLSKNWKKILPITGASGFWTLYLFGLLNKRITTLKTTYYQQGGLYNPLTQIPTAISSYLKLIFWPDALTLYHSEMAFTKVQYLVMLLVCISFLVLTLYFFKKDKKIFFWLSFFVITLLPTLTPLKITWIVAERYAYMPSIGIFTLIAFVIQKLSEKINFEKLPYFFLALVLPLLSWRSIIRNVDWKNQDNLWLAAAKTSPSSPQNHNNLGDLYSRRGDLENAVKEFTRATQLLPNYGDAYHNLANTYLQMGKTDLAIENYQKALSFNPNLWQSHQNLAAIYASQKNFDLALEHLQEGLEVSPNNPSLLTSLGLAYWQKGENALARQTLQKVLQIDPGNKNAAQILEKIP